MRVFCARQHASSEEERGILLLAIGGEAESVME